MSTLNTFYFCFIGGPRLVWWVHQNVTGQIMCTWIQTKLLQFVQGQITQQRDDVLDRRPEWGLVDLAEIVTEGGDGVVGVVAEERRGQPRRIDHDGLWSRNSTHRLLASNELERPSRATLEGRPSLPASCSSVLSLLWTTVIIRNLALYFAW